MSIVIFLLYDSILLNHMQMLAGKWMFLLGVTDISNL